ncbi:class I SAM-dependent methyltransferase [Acinetobacter guerrae]|uniref:class I SAM-dependent methyltransferase n=1 Tax=Acinetobacter guerrae TaxID=1843371 RepID=UPI00125F91CD|nr:class I SAM-dependent methyltransferase [Acinetobacter guerrae]
MNVLQEGYVVDVPYPTFVHRQMMPSWLTMLTQLEGIRGPDIEKPYRYLELGCAMGIQLHLNAAANPIGHFVGVDFNPQQLMVAEEGVQTTKNSNIEFIQADFESFLEYDIEPFDFIVTHGVWSWISEENQNFIIKIINKLLKKNGILYCSYMSHPGATGLTSIQKLMFEMSRNLNGDSAKKAAQSLNLVRAIGNANAGLFRKIPSLTQELSELAQDKINYVAHDFLSEYWQPQHSADMIRQFGKIGLSYIASAGIMENLNRLTLPVEIQNIIKTLPLITLQETVKDISLNTLQRQDIYIKERQQLSQTELESVYSNMKFGLLPDAPVGKDLNQDPKIGRIKDAIDYFRKILTLLSRQDASILELSKDLNQSLTLRQLTDMVLVLVWAGYIHPLRSDKTIAAYEKRTNQWMLAQNLKWKCIAKFGSAIEF